MTTGTASPAPSPAAVDRSDFRTIMLSGAKIGLMAALAVIVYAAQPPPHLPKRRGTDRGGRRAHRGDRTHRGLPGHAPHYRWSRVRLDPHAARARRPRAEDVSREGGGKGEGCPAGSPIS